MEGPLDDKKVIAFIKSAYSKDQLIKIADIGAKKEEILKKYDRDRDGKINLYEFKQLLKDTISSRDIVEQIEKLNIEEGKNEEDKKADENVEKRAQEEIYKC